MSVFQQNLPRDLAAPRDAAEALLLSEYGAVFVSRASVTRPPVIVFEDDAAVAAFPVGRDPFF